MGKHQKLTIFMRTIVTVRIDIAGARPIPSIWFGSKRTR